jgi:hypothetical protein
MSVIGLKAKNPTAAWQWGSEIFGERLEPDRRAVQQRFQKQQVQIAIHDANLASFNSAVKRFSRGPR